MFEELCPVRPLPSSERPCFSRACFFSSPPPPPPQVHLKETVKTNTHIDDAFLNTIRDWCLAKADELQVDSYIVGPRVVQVGYRGLICELTVHSVAEEIDIRLSSITKVAALSTKLLTPLWVETEVPAETKGPKAPYALVAPNGLF